MGKRRRVQKPVKGANRKKKKSASKSASNDDFFDADDDLVASSDEDERKQGENEEEEEENEEAAETVHEKKVRLAKAYLDKLKAQAAEKDEEQNDQVLGDDERRGRRDTIVADILKHEQLEESGRVQRKLASRLVQPEVTAEGTLLVRKHKLSVTALALTDDDKWGFSGSKDGLVLQWDVETGKSSKYEWPSEKTGSKRILALAVDSSGRYLATGGPDRAVQLWDVRTQKHIQAFPGHRGPVSSLAFRQGTAQLFSSSFDRTIKLWSGDDRSYMDTLFGHQSDVLAVDCLRQERVLSAGRDRTLRLWKVPEETQLVFRGYAASIESCCFVTNGEFLSGADDGSVALWSVMRKKPVFVARNAHGPKLDTSHGDMNGGKPTQPSCGAVEAWVGSVAVCRGSDLAATGAGDGKIQLWAVEDGNRSLRPLHELPVKGFVNAVAFARSGRFLVAGVGQEPRLGRWARNREARNGIVLHKIDLSVS